MKNTYIRRCASIMMSLVLCMVITAASTGTADAASKTKSYQVVTKEKSVTTYPGESGSDITIHKYSYNKYGLMKSKKELSGSSSAGSSCKTTYKRNSKGYVTEEKYYEKGKLIERTVYKLKSNGDIKSDTVYTVKGKKSKKSSTSTYTYWSKGKVKKITTKGKDPKTKKSYTYVAKYDKKGYLTSASHKSGKRTVETSCKNSYDKKGNPVKIVSTDKSTNKGKTTGIYTDVVTYTYEYNSKGNPVRCDSEWKLYNGYENSTLEASNTETTTYEYKTVKVPKKYWSFFKK